MNYKGIHTWQWLVLVLAAMGSLVWGYYHLNKKPVTLGAILSLSGPAGHLKDVRDGMVLALEEENRRGGISGRPIRLLMEDSRTDIETALKAFKQMETQHPVAYFSTTSTISLKLGEAAEKNQVVLVSLATASKKVSQGKKWVYTFWTQAEDEIPAIEKIIKRLKVKQVSILFMEDVFGRSIFNFAKNELEKTGVKVMGQSFQMGTRDFSPLLSKITDMPAVYLVGFVGQIKDMIQQIKMTGYKGHIIGSSGTINVHFLSDPSLTHGVFAPVPSIYNPNFPFVKNMRKKFEKRFNRSLSHQAAAGYESFNIMAGLLRKGKIERQVLQKTLEKGFIHQGSLGETCLKPGRHIAGFDLHPAKFIQGEIVFIR